MAETNVVSDQILNSWKEIARYLNRGVRTVQRWETELGLPVRRPRGRRRSAVIAMRSEIDQWLNSCPLEAREQVAGSSLTGRPPAQAEHDHVSLSELILSSRLLRSDLDRTRKELQSMVRRLVGSIEAYRLLVQELPPPSKKKIEPIEALKVVDITRFA